MTRLEQLKRYLSDAHPVNDALYIEDLKLSIRYQETIEKQKKIEVREGFELTRG